MIVLVAISCALALLPALVFFFNLPLYAPLPPWDGRRRSCSILIPARNEDQNIGAAISSVLQSKEIDFEIIVLDDHSEDGTRHIVSTLAGNDVRVRLEPGETLPPNWTGKNFACQQLANVARFDFFVFMDADVRITREDSLRRLVQFLESSNAGLVSGIPLQETSTLAERLIIPLIHFILLGFLPLRRMRQQADPRLAAACGQIIATRRADYVRSGGHAAIRSRIHDAVALARNFRVYGIRTDLFDATNAFGCRMYRGARQVWNGFAKNAHEALASPTLILPATLVLLLGQVMPFILLASLRNRALAGLSLFILLVIYLPRFIAVVRFRQSFLSAILHPFAILTLLAVQWSAFFQWLRRQPPLWKGRVCAFAPGN